MFSSEEIEGFTRRLAEAGLALTESLSGPIGQKEWTFSNETADLQVGDDRAVRYVAVGSRRAACFVMDTWATLLEINPPESPDFYAQLDYALENLNLMEATIKADNNILESLREANWPGVRQALNLDPDAPRPGQP
jgi:hypothetical protein